MRGSSFSDSHANRMDPYSYIESTSTTAWYGFRAHKTKCPGPLRIRGILCILRAALWLHPAACLLVDEFG